MYFALLFGIGKGILGGMLPPGDSEELLIKKRPALAGHCRCSLYSRSLCRFCCLFAAYSDRGVLYMWGEETNLKGIPHCYFLLSNFCQ